MPRDALTVLSDLADVVARDLLLECLPKDRPGHAVVQELRRTSECLHQAGRVIPASVEEVIGNGAG